MADLPVLPGNKKSGQARRKVTDISEGRPPSEEFMIPAQDLKGHSARVGFRVEPQMVRLVAELVQAGGRVFGWKTDSDFWRWAGWAGLQYAVGLSKNKKLMSEQGMLSITITLIATKQRMLEFEETFRSMETTASALIEKGFIKEATAMLAEIQEKIMAQEDSVWKRRWQREFDKKFKHLEGK
jgi:hypothetical protein